MEGYKHRDNFCFYKTALKTVVFKHIIVLKLLILLKGKVNVHYIFLPRVMQDSYWMSERRDERYILLLLRDYEKKCFFVYLTYCVKDLVILIMVV